MGSCCSTCELADVVGCDPLDLVLANPQLPWRHTGRGMALELHAGDVVRTPDGRELELHSTRAAQRLERGTASRTGDATFATYSSDANFVASWGKVAATLNAEGIGEGDALFSHAQEQFTSAFDQMLSSNIDEATALQGAQQLVVAGQTVAGAIGQVQGLVSAAASSSPGAAFQQFTGTLVAVASLAGPVSAGAGAAIALGAQVVGTVLNDLFGGPPSVATLCNANLQFVPTFVVECVATEAPQIDPGSYSWRRFPVPGGKQVDGSSDDVWFAQGWTATAFTWTGATWFATSLLVDHLNGQDNRRPIEIAFLPNVQGNAPGSQNLGYWQAQNIGATGGDLGAMVWAAWKANAELKLNGAKGADDWQVFSHVVQLWNRAHDGGTYEDLTPSDPLYGSLVTQVREHSGLVAEYLVDGNLRVYTGPQKSAAAAHRVIALHVGGGGGASSSATSTGISTGAKVAIGTGVAGVGLAGLWWYLGKPMSFAAFKHAFGHAFRGA